MDKSHDNNGEIMNIHEFIAVVFFGAGMLFLISSKTSTEYIASIFLVGVGVWTLIKSEKKQNGER